MGRLRLLILVACAVHTRAQTVGADDYTWSLADSAHTDFALMSKKLTVLVVDAVGRTAAGNALPIFDDLASATGTKALFYGYGSSNCGSFSPFPWLTYPMPKCSDSTLVDCAVSGTRARFVVKALDETSASERHEWCFQLDNRPAGGGSAAPAGDGVRVSNFKVLTQPELQPRQSNFRLFDGITLRSQPRCEEDCSSGECRILDAFDAWGLGRGDLWPDCTRDQYVQGLLSTLVFDVNGAYSGGVFYATPLQECGVGDAGRRYFPYKLDASSDATTYELSLPASGVPLEWRGYKLCAGWAIDGSNRDISAQAGSWTPSMFTVDLGSAVRLPAFGVQIGNAVVGLKREHVILPSGLGAPMSVTVTTKRAYTLQLRSDCSSSRDAGNAITQDATDSSATVTNELADPQHGISYEVCFMGQNPPAYGSSQVMIPLNVSVAWDAEAATINQVKSGTIAITTQEFTLTSLFGRIYNLVDSSTTTCTGANTIFRCDNNTRCAPSVAGQFKLCVEGFTGWTTLSLVSLDIAYALRVSAATSGDVHAVAGLPVALPVETSAASDTTTKRVAVASVNSCTEGVVMQTTFAPTATTATLSSTALAAGSYRVCLDDGSGAYEQTDITVVVSSLVIEGEPMEGDVQRIAVRNSPRTLLIAGTPSGVTPTARFTGSTGECIVAADVTMAADATSPWPVRVQLAADEVDVNLAAADSGYTAFLCIDLMGGHSDDGSNFQRTRVRLQPMLLSGSGDALSEAGNLTTIRLVNADTEVPADATFSIHEADNMTNKVGRYSYRKQTAESAWLIDIDADVPALELVTGAGLIVVMYIPVGALSTGFVPIELNAPPVEWFVANSGEDIIVTRMRPFIPGTNLEGQGHWVPAGNNSHPTVIGLISGTETRQFEIGGGGLYRSDGGNTTVPRVGWSTGGCTLAEGDVFGDLTLEYIQDSFVLSVPTTSLREFVVASLCIGWQDSAYIRLPFRFVVAPAPLYFSQATDSDEYTTDNFGASANNDPVLLALTNSHLTMKAHMGYRVPASQYTGSEPEWDKFVLRVGLSWADCSTAQFATMTYAEVRAVVNEQRADPISGGNTLVATGEVTIPLTHYSTGTYYVCVSVGVAGDEAPVDYLAPTKVRVAVTGLNINRKPAPEMLESYGQNTPIDFESPPLQMAMLDRARPELQVRVPYNNTIGHPLLVLGVWTAISFALGPRSGGGCASLNARSQAVKTLTYEDNKLLMDFQEEFGSVLGGQYDLCATVARQPPSITGSQHHLNSMDDTATTDVFMFQSYAPTGFVVDIVHLTKLNTFALSAAAYPSSRDEYNRMGLFQANSVEVLMEFSSRDLSNKGDDSTYRLVFRVDSDNTGCRNVIDDTAVTTSRHNFNFESADVASSRFKTVLSTVQLLADTQYILCVGIGFVDEPTAYLEVPIVTVVTPLPGLEYKTSGAITTVSSRLKVCQVTDCRQITAGAAFRMRIITADTTAVAQPCESKDLASQTMVLSKAGDEYVFDIPRVADLGNQSRVVCLEYGMQTYYMPVSVRLLQINIDSSLVWSPRLLSVPVGASSTGLSQVEWALNVTDSEWALENQLWFKFADAAARCGINVTSDVLQGVSPNAVAAETCTTGGRLVLSANEYARLYTDRPVVLCVAAASVAGGRPIDEAFGATSITYTVTDAPAKVNLMKQPMYIDRTQTGLTFAGELEYEILGSRGERVTKLAEAVVVQYELYECEMVEVEDCIQQCETTQPPTYPAFDTTYYDPVNQTFDRRFSRVGELSCVALCEEASIANCSDPSSWILKHDNQDTVSPAQFELWGHRLVTRIQNNFEVAYRYWYRVYTTVRLGNKGLQSHTSAPFVLAPCYDWRSGHWDDDRVRFNGTRFDSDAYFPNAQFAIPYSSQCGLCPPGGLCDGSTEVRSEPNFWRANHNALIFYDCSEPLGSDSCLGNTSVGQCQTGYRTHVFDNSFEDGVHDRTDDNPLCVMCAEGYGRQVNTGPCGKCPDAAVTWTITFLVAFVVVIVLMATVISTLHTSQRNEKNELAVMVRMFLSYISVASLTGNYGTLYADVLKDMLGVQKAAGGQIIGQVASLDCIFPSYSYYDRFWLVMMLPMIFAFLLGLVFGPIFRLARVHYRKKKERREEMRARTWFGTMLIKDVVVEEPEVEPYEGGGAFPEASGNLENGRKGSLSTVPQRAKSNGEAGGMLVESLGTDDDPERVGSSSAPAKEPSAQMDPWGGSMGVFAVSSGHEGPGSDTASGEHALARLASTMNTQQLRDAAGDQRLREIRRELIDVYDDIDRNKNGHVSRYELRVALTHSKHLETLVAVHFRSDVDAFLEAIMAFKPPVQRDSFIGTIGSKPQPSMRNVRGGVRGGVKRRTSMVQSPKAEHAPVGAVTRYHFMCFFERREWKRQTGVDITIVNTEAGNEQYELPKIDAHQDELGAKLGFHTSAMFKAYIASLIIFLVVIYPTVAETAVNFLQCDTLNWGIRENVTLQESYEDSKLTFSRSIFRHDRNIDCDTDKFKRYRVLALFCLLIYGVCFPIGTMLMCRVMRGNQEVRWSESPEERLERRQRLQDSRLLFGFLMVGYTRKMWFWEAVVMLRKLTMVCISVYVEDTLSTYVAMWTMSICCILQLRCQPYDHRDLNRIEFISLFVIAATLNMSLLYRPESGGFAEKGVPDEQIVGFWILTTLLMVSNLLLVIYFLYWIVVYLRVMATDIVRENLHSVNRIGDSLPRVLRVWLMREWEGKVFYARNEDTGERRVLESGAIPMLYSERQNFLGSMRENLKSVVFLRRKQLVPVAEIKPAGGSDSESVPADRPMAAWGEVDAPDDGITIGSVVKRQPDAWDDAPEADGTVDTFGSFDVPTSMLFKFDIVPLDEYYFKENRGADHNGMPTWRTPDKRLCMFLNADKHWVVAARLSDSAKPIFTSKNVARDVMPHRHFKWVSHENGADRATSAATTSPATGEFGTVVAMKVLPSGQVMVRVLWDATPHKPFNPNMTHLHRLDSLTQVVRERGEWRTLLFSDILWERARKITAYGRINLTQSEAITEERGRTGRIRAVVKTVPRQLKEDDPSKIGRMVYCESCCLGWPEDEHFDGDQQGNLRQTFGQIGHAVLPQATFDEAEKVARGMTHHYEASDTLLAHTGVGTAVQFQYWQPYDRPPLLSIEPLHYSYEREWYGMKREINATEPGFQVCVKTGQDGDRRRGGGRGKGGDGGVDYDDELFDILEREEYDSDDDPDELMMEVEDAKKRMKLLEERVARQAIEIALLQTKNEEYEEKEQAMKGQPQIGEIMDNLDAAREEKEKLAGMYVRAAEEVVFLKQDREDLATQLAAQRDAYQEHTATMEKKIKRTFAMAQRTEASLAEKDQELKETRMEADNYKGRYDALAGVARSVIEQQRTQSDLQNIFQDVMRDFTPGTLPLQPTSEVKEAPLLDGKVDNVSEDDSLDKTYNVEADKFKERLEKNRLRLQLAEARMKCRAAAAAARSRQRLAVEIEAGTIAEVEIAKYRVNQSSEAERLDAALAECIERGDESEADELAEALKSLKNVQGLLAKAEGHPDRAMSPKSTLLNDDNARIEKQLSDNQVELERIMQSDVLRQGLASAGAALGVSRPGTADSMGVVAHEGMTHAEKRRAARELLGSMQSARDLKKVKAERANDDRPSSARPQSSQLRRRRSSVRKSQ